MPRKEPGESHGSPSSGGHCARELVWEWESGGGTFLSFILFSWPRGMRNLSSLARIAPTPPALEVQSLNPWTTREVPKYASLIPVVSLGLLQEEYLTSVIHMCVYTYIRTCTSRDACDKREQ